MIGLNPGAQAMMQGRPILPGDYPLQLVKFPNTRDGKDAGPIEYVDARMAAAARVAMTKPRIFTTEHGA